jgi:hypothetical protein
MTILFENPTANWLQVFEGFRNSFEKEIAKKRNRRTYWANTHIVEEYFDRQTHKPQYDDIIDNNDSRIGLGVR